jgi:hypothetical protein
MFIAIILSVANRFIRPNLKTLNHRFLIEELLNFRIFCRYWLKELLLKAIVSINLFESS